MAKRYKIEGITNTGHGTCIAEVLLTFSKHNLKLVLTVTGTKELSVEAQVARYMRQIPREEWDGFHMIDYLITIGKLEVTLDGYVVNKEGGST